MKEHEKRLRALEGREQQRKEGLRFISLEQWRTYHETGELPEGEREKPWYKQAQIRQQQAAELLALFEDNPNPHNQEQQL